MAMISPMPMSMHKIWWMIGFTEHAIDYADELIMRSDKP